MIHILFENSAEYKLNMVNVYGEIVWTYFSKDEFIPIDLNNYAKGIYFVVLSNDHTSAVLKWVVN